MRFDAEDEVDAWIQGGRARRLGESVGNVLLRPMA